MPEHNGQYFINNPIFVKYKTRFDFLRLKKVRHLKSVVLNERIIEIPYAIRCVSALPMGKMVLDLGCTESTLSLNLAGLGYKVVGIDFRPYPYIHPNLRVLQGNILQLPLRNESFDAVLSISTIEHMGIGFYSDPQAGQHADRQAMAEISRVLQPGGLAVLTVPYGVGSVNAHHRVYDQRTLDELLNSFEVAEIRYFASSREARSRANFWSEVSSQQAARIESPDTANCVCLVQAFRRGA